MTLPNKSIRGLVVLSYNDLTDRLHYDPKTGIFTWKINKLKLKKGKEAGFFAPSKGYKYIRLYNKEYPSHRLAWFYMTKIWPEKSIGFKNKDSQDLRFLNLMHCDHYDLQSNRRTSQYLTGTSFRKEKKSKPWNARIYKNGKAICLGYFATEREAHRIYLKAKKEIKFELSTVNKKVPSKR